MSLKRLVLFCLVIQTFSLSSRAQESPLRLSLQDCLELASKNNAKLEASDYDIEGANWRFVETKARFMPIIEFSNRMAPAPRDAANAAESFFRGDVTFFDATKVGVFFPFYGFGKITTAGRLALKGVEAAQERKKKDEKEIRFEVKQLYYGILLGEDLKELAVDAIEKMDDKLKEEEEAKEHTPYEIAKLKVFKLDLERRLTEAIEREKLAKEALKIQLGLPRERNFRLSDTDLQPIDFPLKPLKHYLESAGVNEPNSHLVDIGLQSKQLELKLEKKKLLPLIGFGGFVELGRTTDSIRNLKATDDFNNPFNYTRAGVGFELKGQIDVHASHARIKRLRSEYNKAMTEGSLAKEGLALEVQNVYEDALRYQKDLQQADERRRLAHQMVFLSKSNLDVGVGEDRDYTDALQLLLFARGEYLKAVFDYNVALAKLEWKAGRGEQ